MQTTVKYVVLKSLDYQLGTPLFQEELDADANYFETIPAVISYQNHQFQVVSKELKRVFVASEKSDTQKIVVRVISL
jgi:hypothetical protein